MHRIEKELMTDWKFWFGEKEGKKPENVELPHDWVIEAPYTADKKEAAQGFHIKRGTGYYEKELFIEVMEEHRYFLDFGGIYEKSQVFVNGQLVGERKYGYSPFRLEITPFVKNGSNLVEVRVDSDEKITDRWYTGAGIYRTVKLLETGNVYLDEKEVVVHTIFPGEGYEKAVVRVTVPEEMELKGSLKLIQHRKMAESCACENTGVEKAACEGTESVTYENEGIENLTCESKDGNLEFIVTDPRLWTAEEPNLYELKLKRLENGEESDSVSLKIGLRKVEFVKEKGLLVNGRQVKLHGVCVHQDAGCVGVAARKEIWKGRLLDLKEMGCNAIRPAHHVYAEEFMDLCDELGFYVYEECFDKWTGGHYGSFFDAEWEKDVEVMVKRDRNRPSVIIWGVGNEVENQGQESMLRILKMLVAKVKTLDVSRPVTCAMNPHFKRESKVDLSKITDIQQFVDEADDTEIWDIGEKVERICRIGELVDIISCNYQEQWYEEIHKAVPDKLILGTEVYQYYKGHALQFKNFTEDNPSLVPERYPYVIGSMIWTGISYLGESMGYPAKGWNGALLRTNGVRKAGYYLMQSYWSRKPMVHFEVMDYSLEDEGVKDHWDMPPYAAHWHFPQFSNAVLPYMIATNCEEVELYVNDNRIYLPTKEETGEKLIRGFLTWTPGNVTVIGKNGGKEVCRQELVTPKAAAMLALSEKAANTVDTEKCFVTSKAAEEMTEKEAAQRKEAEAKVAESVSAEDGQRQQSAIKLSAIRGYQKMLHVRALDEEGNFCFRESARVRFCVEGPAVIVGVDSGDAKSLESFREPWIHLYQGQASVMLRLTGEEGRIRLTAYGDGMRSAVLELCVEAETGNIQTADKEAATGALQEKMESGEAGEEQDVWKESSLDAVQVKAVGRG